MWSTILQANRQRQSSGSNFHFLDSLDFLLEESGFLFSRAFRIMNSPSVYVDYCTSKADGDPVLRAEYPYPTREDE